jgi:phenylacetate-CoA ligase
MNHLIDPALGWVLNKLGDVALTSFSAYRMLFMPALGPGLRDWLSRKRAAAVFYRARRRVPAYQQFLREHSALSPRAFSDIPPMDKESYIKRHSLPALCQGGVIPKRGVVIDESSGSTGTATNWVRGADERFATRRLIQFSARATFGGDSFVLLNSFALGPWATGMNVSMSLVDRCIMKSIGPDAKKVISTLKLLGPGYRYVITGYPPFLKGLVESTDIDWQKYDVVAVVGGEGMSEPLRAALNRGFRKTISSFGASDLEINLAVETDFSIALRQELAKNAALSRDLCGGSEGLPMAFQYDPLNAFIETDSERNLLFTLNRLENVSPRIRYNLHDRGIVRSRAEVETVLADHRIRIDVPGPALHLPFILHWGRQDSAVAFYGCKITPEDLQNVILRVPLLAAKVENYALHPFEDAAADKRLEFWLELASGVTLAPSPELEAAMLEELARINQDFRESARMIPEGRRPTVKLFPFGQSPISNQDIRIKRRYIV